MNDALRVGRLEGEGERLEDLRGGAHAEPAAANALAEALADQPLHDEERPPVRKAAEAEDIDDVRVADLVDRARFLDEPRDGVVVPRQLGVEHLDGRPLPDDRVDDRVDLPHAAGAEAGLDLVFAHHVAARQLHVEALRAHIRCRQDARFPHR